MHPMRPFCEYRQEFQKSTSLLLILRNSVTNSLMAVLALALALLLLLLHLYIKRSGHCARKISLNDALMTIEI